VEQEQNKASFVKVIRAWQTQDIGALRDLTMPDYVGHTRTGDRDFEGLVRRIREFASRFQHVNFNVEDQFATGNKVVTRMTATAISSETGQPVLLLGMNISRFENGLLAEEWPLWEISQT
jgi:hypothetical protein